MSLGRTKVAVVAVAEGDEAAALRSMLEGFGGIEVECLPVGRPSELAAILAGNETQARYLFLSCHGDERGLLLPGLPEELAAEEPFTDVLTPELASELISLPGRFVLSTGCNTGALAPAFAGGGARTFVAPSGSPEGAEALLLAAVFSYQLLVQRHEPIRALDLAKRAAGDAGAWDCTLGDTEPKPKSEEILFG